jgi:hypothetical protein
MNFQLNKFGRAFASRTMGTDLVEQVCSQRGDEAEVVIDFEGVSTVSQSFVDSFVGVLTQRAIEDGDFELKVTNVSAQLLPVVESVRDRRRAFALSRS